MKHLKNICLIGKNFSSGLYINSEALPNPILVDGKVSWSLLHQVYEKEKKCEEDKYPAPKLTDANLHPGISKQNVDKALAIFEPSTIAADRMYFPASKDAAGFLHLVHVW